MMLASLVLLFPAASGLSLGELDAETAMAAPAENSLSWTMLGYNYASWWHDEYFLPESDAALTRMAGTGANWVAIVPTQYMATDRSDIIAPESGERTAGNAAVAKAIDDAHAKGLKVLLKPHVDVKDGTSRVFIQPTNPTAWFASYRQMITGYAQLANDHGVEMMAVGTELSMMVTANHYNEWASVISQVRAVYHGPITYAASQNDLEDPATVSFSGLLDYLGADLYFPLSDQAEPTVDELVRGWTEYDGTYGRYNRVAQIEAWQAYWDKPVIFTEMGYRSVKYSARTPWDYSFEGTYDGDLQARIFESVFQVFGNKPWLKGVFWWNWAIRDNGGPGDTNYMIINKPAEAVVTSWFTSTANTQPTLSITSSNVSWNSYADYRERLLHVAYNVSNNSGTVRQVAVVAGTAGSGVVLVSGLPVNIGDILQGSSAGYQAVYRVPSGITSFRAIPYISFIDTDGRTNYLPDMPPVVTG